MTSEMSKYKRYMMGNLGKKLPFSMPRVPSVPFQAVKTPVSKNHGK